MWTTFQAAYDALTHDGWRRYTSYWFCKRIGGSQTLWIELEWIGGRLHPVEHVEEED